VGGTYNANGEKITAYMLLVGKPAGKRPIGRPKCRCVDNIKIESCTDRVGWCGLDWSGSG
jgi:hypothetical protein